MDISGRFVLVFREVTAGTREMIGIIDIPTGLELGEEIKKDSK